MSLVKFVVKHTDTLLLVAAAVAIAWMWQTRCGAERFAALSADQERERTRRRRRKYAKLLAKHVCAKTGFKPNKRPVNGVCPQGEFLGPRGLVCGKCM